jgi:hypothetical protein
MKKVHFLNDDREWRDFLNGQEWCFRCLRFIVLSLSVIQKVTLWRVEEYVRWGEWRMRILFRKQGISSERSFLREDEECIDSKSRRRSNLNAERTFSNVYADFSDTSQRDWVDHLTLTDYWYGLSPKWKPSSRISNVADMMSLLWVAHRETNNFPIHPRISQDKLCSRSSEDRERIQKIPQGRFFHQSAQISGSHPFGDDFGRWHLTIIRSSALAPDNEFDQSDKSLAVTQLFSGVM